MYTSGSTGSPKGTLITHSNVVRVVRNTNYITLTKSDRILQLSNYSFDGSIFDIFGSLLNGAALIINPDDISSLEKVSTFIKKAQITVFFVTTALFNVLVNEDIGCFENVRKVLFGGERVSVEHTKRLLEYIGKNKIIHMYGPTETTVFATYYIINKIDNTSGTIPIGGPVANTSIYIVDRKLNPVPVGLVGEIYIGGDGAAARYLNNPELTSEKFEKSPFIRGERLYRAGDLARWLPDGNLEFIGRVDQQVKLRGFRIELEEIERHILNYENIKKAVVYLKKNNNGEKYLCASIVSKKRVDGSDLQKYLMKKLPDYMVPSFIVQVNKIPLTLSGKIDRKLLPTFELTPGKEYSAPEDDIDYKLVKIWSDVLGIAQGSIGIDHDFFELGGHSLKTIQLVSRIHKAFNVKVTIAEIFENPTVRKLAGYIKGSVKDKYKSVKTVEKRDYYALSSSQKRLFFMQEMYPTNTVYNISVVRNIEGVVDIKQMEAAVQKLINRHESLRTSFTLSETNPVQVVNPSAVFAIEYIETYYENVINDFIRPFDLSKPPLLRMGLVQVEQGRYILVIDMHHITADGSSMDIIKRDFKAIFTGETLPSLRIQYKDFADWQNDEMQKQSTKKQEEFWLKEFAGELPALTLPVDFPRPVVRRFSGGNLNFQIGEEHTGLLRELASSRNATMFMTLLAIYNVVFSKISGREDIIVGSAATGRKHVDLEDVIGMFANTLAFRNKPESEKTFVQFLGEVVKKTIKVFENQDYPFEELIEKLNIPRDINSNPVFDIGFSLNNQSGQAAMENADPIKQPETGYSYNLSSKVDIILFATEIDRRILMDMTYSSEIFERSTIERIVKSYLDILGQIVRNKDKKLKDFKISDAFFEVKPTVSRQVLDNFGF
ncbi:condensation domain-containing protein, partial [Acidobacteriota bacterium]